MCNLLDEHLQEFAAQSPPESMHALPLDELKSEDVTFWCAWQEYKLPAPTVENKDATRHYAYAEPKGLMGFVALKRLTREHAELKSMRTAGGHQRKGVATALLKELLRVAQLAGYARVSLETGTLPSFQPAIELYKRFGFDSCSPFADYEDDPNSCYMSCLLEKM